MPRDAIAYDRVGEWPGPSGDAGKYEYECRAAAGVGLAGAVMYPPIEGLEWSWYSIFKREKMDNEYSTTYY